MVQRKGGRTSSASPTAKRCAVPPKGCGLQQSIKHFERRAESKDGYRGQCKRCMNLRGKSASRRASRLRQYGITAAQYDLLIQRQKGVCAICYGVNLNGKRLAVDHNHKTGEVRGLLCDACNRGIGYFEDDTERIKAAVNYLRDHR